MAARLGDPTVHGGTIVMGFPTVMIGIPGSGSGGGGGGAGGAGGSSSAPRNVAGAGPGMMEHLATQFILAGPVGNAFTSAAKSGAPLVCKGPCEACGEL
jgi:hypothetical protein